MNRIRHLVLLVAGLSACSLTFANELIMTNPLLSKSRPWCIGRFVFDRPISSELTNQEYKFRGEKLGTQHNASMISYQAKIDALEKEYRTKKRFDPSDPNNKMGHAWLEKAFSPKKDSMVFVYQNGVAKVAKLPFDTEGYIYENSTLFHTVGRIGSAAIGRAEDIYNDTYRRIKARENWTVPTESGFCFDGGLVTGASTYSEEVTQSLALLPGRPALLVIEMRDSVSSDQGRPLTKTLPDLRAKMDQISSGSYRILRQGKRTVAGMDAEEVLFALKEGEVTSYRFYLLAPGDPSTLAKPHTAIQLLLGASSPNLSPEEATSPVDEAGALQTWETLLNSLHLRPGAV
ncbi:T6SS immunity protein Tli4 family protein [Burkholderia cepacia]|uniref:T6SS immunity protein Tli4 family protein n=1 Tax=Burkholderia cepacia TaxID=292 RepID=UPI00298D99EF|nr:T6SS immunity protein Tli4 family protein [Burkholderia cepacia]